MATEDFLWTGCRLSDADRQIATERLRSSNAEWLLIPVADSPGHPSPWRQLPPSVAALVIPPEAVACVVGRQGNDSSGDARWRQILDAETRSGVSVETSLSAVNEPFERPGLCPVAEATLPDWRLMAIDSIVRRHASEIVSEDDAVALQAGLLQIADQLEASHELAQSVEQRGRNQAGDYWHAIQHRREPDYGNAKYWFRRVGPHPLLRELAADAAAILNHAPPEVVQAFDGVVVRDAVDPFRFTDIVEHAVRPRDKNVLAGAEQLQWGEMVRLLAWTWRDATSA